MKKYLFYLAIMCFGGTGDVMLKRGMMDLGPVTAQNWTHIFAAMLNPWILLGVICLVGFFYSYLTALSFADLTYVLPATAFGYVVIALWSKFFLHENISSWRWSGVLLIACGVGLVARGPSVTEKEQKAALAESVSA
jgi:drug/metabolite transporter (DMT)-like permease